MNKPINCQEALEALIDRHGLHNVTEMLAIICDLKADHLAANWQDDYAARRWSSASKAFDAVVPKLRNIPGA